MAPSRLKVWILAAIFIASAVMIVASAVLLMNLKSQPSFAQGANLILFWDGATSTIPSGWICISCVSGDPFFNVFPGGEVTYGTSTPGSDTHIHTASGTTAGPSASENGPSTCPPTCPDNLAAPAGIGNEHTHIFDATTSGASLPQYRSLLLIRASGIPSTIPSGTIAIFTASPPAGWSTYTAEDGLFVRGGSTVTTGGSNTHSHSFSATSSVADLEIDCGTAGTARGISAGHTHAVSFTSDTANHRPPFIDIVLGKAASDTSVPLNLIGLFDSAPPSGWTVVSASGGNFYQRFLRASSTTVFPTFGGSVTHTHATSSSTTPNASGPNICTVTSGVTLATNTHNHGNVTVAYTTENNLPAHRNVIIAQNNGAGSTPTAGGIKPVNTAPIIKNFEVSQSTSTQLVTFSYDVKNGEQSFVWVNLFLIVPGERIYDLSFPEFKTSGISVSTATSVYPWFITKSGSWDPTATTQFKDRYIPKVLFRLKVHDGEGGVTEVDSPPMTLNPRVLQQEIIPPGLEKPKSPEETIAEQIFNIFDKITKLQIESAAKVVKNPETFCFGENLRLGLRDKEVTKLQYMLTQADAYSGPITGIFGPLTQQAVIRFQEKYQEEILAPYGLTNGTGFFGPATRVKLNTFFCAPSES